MATYGYFPGCSMEGTSKEYGASTHAVTRALGIELREVEDWSCCGATSAHSTSRDLADALAARNLLLAGEQGFDELVVPCAACYNRTKRVSHVLDEYPERKARIEETLGRAFPKRVGVAHLLEILLRDEHVQRFASMRKRSLEGTKLGAYYGCLLLRPADETGFDDAEQPHTMDDLLRLAGAEPVTWYMKNECCGASLSIPQPDSVRRLVGRIVDNARGNGARALVTACPLCQVNLETRQAAGEGALPIYYITQALGYALGLPEGELGMRDAAGLRAAAAGGVS